MFFKILFRYLKMTDWLDFASSNTLALRFLVVARQTVLHRQCYLPFQWSLVYCDMVWGRKRFTGQN